MLNFFTTATAPIVEPTVTVPIVEPTVTAPTVEPTATAPIVEPTAIAPTVEPTVTVPVLPTVSAGGDSDEFSRDEFLRLYRSKPREFSASYADKYKSAVAKQLAQSISFE